MIIYADILLLVNLSMDILSLYIVGRVRHKRMVARSVALAAFLGAVSSTLMTLFPIKENMARGIVSIIVGIAVSVIMTRIAFGKPPDNVVLLRDSVMLWGGGALLGGIMSVVVSMGEPVYGATTPSYTPVFVVVAALVMFVMRLFSSRVNKESAEVKITAMARTYTVTAIVDSGSFATEPISGISAIIVKSYSLPGIFEELHSADCSLKLRMIPVRGIDGERLLYGFIPEHVEIDGREVSAAIAIDDIKGTFAEHSGVVPLGLCRK